MKPRRQVQTARCLLTEHCALMPHASVVQGSRHFSWMHARWSGHSESVVHSGLGAERACFDGLIMQFYILICSHMVSVWKLWHFHYKTQHKKALSPKPYNWGLGCDYLAFINIFINIKISKESLSLITNAQTGRRRRGVQGDCERHGTRRSYGYNP